MIVHWCWCLVLSGGAIVGDGSISAGACGEIGGGKGGGEIGGALLVVVGSTKKCEAEVIPFSNGGICGCEDHYRHHQYEQHDHHDHDQDPNLDANCTNPSPLGKALKPKSQKNISS